MPHSYFNATFLKAIVAHDTDADAIKSIYDHATPLYFTPSDAAETAHQLQEFKAGDDFAPFKNQYEILITKINQWCIDNHTQLQFRQALDSAALIPAFLLLHQHLFGEADFFSTRAVILFTEGKQSLEQLLLLLGDQSICLDSKKTVLLELQKSFAVCADGVLTNILNAKADLLASTGIEHVLENTKRILIQQQAVSHIKQTHGEVGGKEIHFVNGYFNYVAAAYGLPSMVDTFVDALGISLEQLNQFSANLKQQLTPRVVMEYLISIIGSDVQTLREDIRASFFNKVTDIPLNDQELVKLTTTVDAKMATLTARYAPLMTLNMHAIIETIAHEDEAKPDEYKLAPYHPTLIKAMLVPHFSSKYLVPEHDACRFKIEDTNDSWLIYNNGIYWINQKETPEICTPEIFAKLNPLAYNFLEQRIYYLILADLFHLFPEQQDELLSRLISANYLTQERLSVIDKTEAHAGKNAIWFLASTHFELFEKLLRHKLITSEQLTATAQTGRHAGKNAIWFLVINEKIALLEKLCDDKLITSAHLAALPQTGFHAGKNALWLLANQKHIKLLETLCNDKLITSEQLAAAPQTGSDADVNTLLILALTGELELLEKLYNDKLITSAQLAATPQTGPHAGINAVWMIAFHGRMALLEKLCNDKLITSAQLAAAPQAGPHAGKNSIWFLAFNKHIDVIEKLCNDKLITSEQLAAAPPTGPHAGRNSLWILAFNKHIDMIEKLCNDKLITSAQLTAAPQSGLFARRNALDCLAAGKHFKLLEKLLEDKLITGKQFKKIATESSYTPPQKRPLIPLEHPHHGEAAAPEASEAERTKSAETEGAGTASTKEIHAPPMGKASGYDPTLFGKSAQETTEKEEEALEVAAATSNGQAKKARLSVAQSGNFL